MSESVKYGPHNPHPLSLMRTELVWEGKYDEFGQRREVDVAGLAMSLQKIETTDEPRSRAEAQSYLFDEEKAHRDDFHNRLIWGDNKLVMAHRGTKQVGAAWVTEPSNATTSYITYRKRNTFYGG